MASLIPKGIVGGVFLWGGGEAEVHRCSCPPLSGDHMMCASKTESLLLSHTLRKGSCLSVIS